MRRLGFLFALLATLWLGTAFPGHALPRLVPTVQPALLAGAIPPSYAQVWSDEFNGSTVDCKKNGPLQWNRDTGSGTWSSGQVFQQDLQGSAGQMAEYVPDCQYSATVGGGYPSQGEISVSGGVLTLTAEPTPSSIASLLPATYATFTHTCSISGTDMSCTVATSGTPKTGATITGTGVTAGTKIIAYGTNASASGCTVTCHYTVSVSQTVASTAISSTGAWPYVAGWISTRSSVGFKPPYCMWMRAQLPGATGSWGINWTQTRNQTINAQTNGQVEFDNGEYTPTVLPNEPAENYHWHADNSGGAYNNAGITRKLSITPESGFSDYVVCAPAHVGEQAKWWVNGVLVNSYAIPASTVYEGQYHYVLLNLSMGNDPVFPGVASGTATMKVDFIRVYKPIGSVNGGAVDTGDYFISTAGDGLGAERIFGSPATAGGYSGGWTNRGAGTVTTGSAVDGLPAPGIVKGAASGGSILDGREWFGNTTFGNAVNNQAYQITVDYNYAGSNPSNSILVQFYTPADGTFYRGTVAGTTVTTLQAGGGCTPTVTTVSSHKHLVCTFTAGASAAGGWDITVGPNSTSGSQDVTVYQVSIRPTSVIFP